MNGFIYISYTQVSKSGWDVRR